MAPISLLRHARDFLSDAGDKLKGAGETVVDTGGDVVDKGSDVVDKGKDAADTLGQAKDLVDTFNKLKDQATAYYQWYLDHKPLIYFILCVIAIILFMCLLQCVYQWLMCWCGCCTATVRCGIWCVKCGIKLGPCCGAVCEKGGNCLLRSRASILGKEKLKEADARPDGNTLGCDSTFLTRCGHPPEKGERWEELERQRIGVWINDRLPCRIIPGSWGNVHTPEARRQKVEKQLNFFLDAYKKYSSSPGGQQKKSVAKTLMKTGGRRALSALIELVNDMKEGPARDKWEETIERWQRELKLTGKAERRAAKAAAASEVSEKRDD